MIFQKLLLCTALIAGFTGISNAYVVLTGQHVDVVGVTYSNAQGIGVRVHTDNGDYQPNEVLIYDGPPGSTSVTRPAGSQWDFIGVGEGELLWFWPQSTIVGRIYAGFEAQSVPPGTFQAYLPDDPRISAAASWLSIELVDMRFFDLSGNPADADFSLWSMSGGSAQPEVWMSTADGISESDVFYMLEGGHSHTNWGFSKPGYYQLDIRASGILASTGERVETEVTTFHLGVEYQPEAIPEPAALWLLGLAGVVLAPGLRRLFQSNINQPSK